MQRAEVEREVGVLRREVERRVRDEGEARRKQDEEEARRKWEEEEMRRKQEEEKVRRKREEVGLKMRWELRGIEAEDGTGTGAFQEDPEEGRYLEAADG